MKPFLLFERYEEKPQRKMEKKEDLVTDLNLHIVFETMAKGDPFLYETARNVVLDSVMDSDTLLYRQNVLKDCLQHGSAINRLYCISASALTEAAYYRQYTQPNYARMVSVSVRVVNAVGLLELLVAALEEINAMLPVLKRDFHSRGMNTFCSHLAEHLTDEFFAGARQHIADLKAISEDRKVIIGSGIGHGMKGTGHILRKVDKCPPKTGPVRRPAKTTGENVILLENSSIANSAREMEDAGLIHILRLMNGFNDRILDFFKALRQEAGFYVAGMNLHSTLHELDTPVSFPVPVERNRRTLVFEGLYDLSLAINERIYPVSNDLHADGKHLLVITGANQGGKSTYLRSIGIAQVLMQCGLFVPAARYCANVCDAVFTHFTREEDRNMNSGKLDEELLRMNNIIGCMTCDSMLLMNEPFATTTERDGSRIAADIVTALYERTVKVLFVTHLFEFADSMYDRCLEQSEFLRAERNSNGSRTFCIKQGSPLQTSYGEDLFDSVIG